MRHLVRMSPLWPIVVCVSCVEEQSTAPSSMPARGDPEYSHTAGHIVVNSVADPGSGGCNASECTFREAIIQAGSSEITFAEGLSGPITLAPLSRGGGQLVINKPLRITGPDGGIAIRRANADPDSRIFRIGASGNVWLTHLIIRNGRLAERAGGGIANDGILNLVNSTVERNSAEQGGGIHNAGELSLISSTISANSARFGAGIDNHGPLHINHSMISENVGGGIFNHNNERLAIVATTIRQNLGRGVVNDGGILTLANSMVSENIGGGISQDRGTARLNRVRILDNSDASQGGGIFLGPLGDITLLSSTVARNSATDGGGIANRGGSITVNRSTISGNSATNRGGGILNRDFIRQSSGLVLTNSTVSGNSASSGGGVFNSGDLVGAGASLTNSTVARNSASLQGGGIVQEFDASGFLLRNSLVAENTAPTSPDVSNDEAGQFSARFSLIGDGSGSGISNTDGNQVGTSSSPIDPKIGALANNGGPTRTHALLAGSPAIDAASDADCPPRDQRGVPRPQGAGCDIGSYEKE